MSVSLCLCVSVCVCWAVCVRVGMHWTRALLCAGVVSTNFSQLNIVKLISEVTGNLRKSAKTLKGFAHPPALFSAYNPSDREGVRDRETERERWETGTEAVMHTLQFFNKMSAHLTTHTFSVTSGKGRGKG